MATYSIGRRTTNTTSGQAAFDLAESTGIRALLNELQFTLGAGTASTYGLNRATALGTRTTPVAILGENDGDPTLTGITLIDTALAHSVQPTLASEYHRRISLPATIGAGVFWTFPKGFRIGVSLSAVLQNLATNGVLDVTAVVEI